MALFSKTIAAISDKVEEMVIPKPTGTVKAEMDGALMQEYSRVAKAIGLEDSPALQLEMLRATLERENIRTYNSKHVHRFLDAKLGKDKWVWAGLRKSDVEHRAGWNDGDGVLFGRNQYTYEVPLPVLLTVETILKNVPDAHFYISTDQTDDDPFLYVVCGVNGFIVERWDEPDFRDR